MLHSSRSMGSAPFHIFTDLIFSLNWKRYFNCQSLLRMMPIVPEWQNFYQGAGKDFDTAAFIVIGTGVGGALFQQGKLIKGAHLYGGEFGLMVLDKGKSFRS